MFVDLPALVFGPGLPPGGIQGKLSITSFGVEVSAADFSKRTALAEIQLREVGFGQFGLELAWTETGKSAGDDEHRWAVHVLDEASAKSLLNQSLLASTPQAQTLRGAKRRHTTGRTLGWSLLSLFVFFPVILLIALIMGANHLTNWIADRIPIEEEMKWGREAFENMRSSVKVLDNGAGYEAVQSIGKKLAQHSKYRYEFHVVDNKTLNAFAMPGGVVVVHSGLIAATKRPEELAGVLAHEIQHVELRHSIRGAVKDLGLRGLWALATGDLGSSIAGQAALEMTSLKFSRDAESEADEYGFDALVAAHIDPSGMPAFFKTMSEKAIDAPVAFISTHPLSTEREARLKEKVAKISQVSAPLDYGPWPPVEIAVERTDPKK